MYSLFELLSSLPRGPGETRGQEEKREDDSVTKRSSRKHINGSTQYTYTEHMHIHTHTPCTYHNFLYLLHRYPYETHHLLQLTAVTEEKIKGGQKISYYQLRQKGKRIKKILSFPKHFCHQFGELKSLNAVGRDEGGGVRGGDAIQW